MKQKLAKNVRNDVSHCALKRYRSRTRSSIKQETLDCTLYSHKTKSFSSELSEYENNGPGNTLQSKSLVFI